MGVTSYLVTLFFDPWIAKVLKPGLGRTVRLGKPRIVHFCGSFSLKNRFMGKKQEPVRTLVGPHDFENRMDCYYCNKLLLIQRFLL